MKYLKVFYDFCFLMNIQFNLWYSYVHLQIHEQADTKKSRAEKLLAKIDSSMVPAGPDNRRETITDEERVMFRVVGLRLKVYLQLGE